MDMLWQATSHRIHVIAPPCRCLHFSQTCTRKARPWVFRCRQACISAHSTVGRREVLSASLAIAAGHSMAHSVHASSAAELAQIPRTELAPGLSISKAIKGAWQLSGGHRYEMFACSDGRCGSLCASYDASGMLCNPGAMQSPTEPVGKRPCKTSSPLWTRASPPLIQQARPCIALCSIHGQQRCCLF